ncbi:M16 family metallopeptidase [Actinoplanes rectilineatus]|uniref:M16 family metallopeptidase n=1 Tax=Actinoplanes rectilineatus TaxID=113571 RepID=UPI000698FA00|nr:insulinase family protein [Actinoplanes rectilineatus]
MTAGPVIERREVDGVPVLLGPGEGPMRAGLVFRVGQADEPLSRRGITHLVEHLALFRTGVADHHYNGETGAEHTAFHLQGTPDEVAAFLTGVCASLRDLPMERLTVEKDILRTEASTRGRGATHGMRMWRHGATAHGTPGYPEWGLSALTPDDLRAWTARYFTRGNAVLWIAGGDVPAGLRLDLPAGDRQPAPPVPSALPVRPAWFTGVPGMVAWDTELPEGPAAAVFTALLGRRLTRELRHEAGLSASVTTAYEPRADGRVLVTATADAVPEQSGALLGGFVDVLAAIRWNNPDQAELSTVVSLWCDGTLRAEQRGARLAHQAFRVLTGHPVERAGDLLAAARELTVADVAAVATTAYEAGLLMVPPGTTGEWASYAAAPTTSFAAVHGRDLPIAGAEGRRLVAGSEGISLVDGADTATVRYADCVALLVWPDGGRRLVGRDGITVPVEPTLLGRPAALLAEIDAAVPAGVRIDLPARDPGTVPQPPPRPSAGSRMVRAITRLMAGRWKITAAVVVSLLLLASGVSDGCPHLVITPIAMILGYAGWSHFRDRP